jgi:hypothetical protein
VDGQNSEGVDSSWLRHLRSAFENPFSMLVNSGNTDDNVAVVHRGVFDLDCVDQTPLC